MLQVPVEQSCATKTSANIALGNSSKKTSAPFESAYETWQAAWSLRNTVDNSPDNTPQEWVDRESDRSHKAIVRAERRLAGIPAKSNREIACKVEVLKAGMAYERDGTGREEFQLLINSILSDVTAQNFTRRDETPVETKSSSANTSQNPEPLVAIGRELQALWGLHHEADVLSSKNAGVIAGGYTAKEIMEKCSDRIGQLEETAPVFCAQSAAGAIVSLLMLGSISRTCTDEAESMAADGTDKDPETASDMRKRGEQIQALVYSVMGVLREMAPGAYETSAGESYLGDRYNPFRKKVICVPNSEGSDTARHAA